MVHHCMSPVLLREGWVPQIPGKIGNVATELRIRITTRAAKKKKKERRPSSKQKPD